MRENKIIKDLEIGDDLSQEMTRQSALYCYYALQSVKAQDLMNRTKLSLELKQAELDSVVRAEMTASGTKLREASVEAEIRKDEGWKEIYNRLLNEKLDYETLSAAADAYKMRAQMLSGLGAMRRAEMEQETAIGTPARNIHDVNRANAALKRKIRNK